MADADDADRVLVVVLPPTAYSPGELVRAGFRLWRLLDEDALEHLLTHKSEMVICWAASDDQLRELIAEAVVNDEWLAVRRHDGGVASLAVGPLHLEHSPILLGAVARCQEFGPAEAIP